MNITTIKNILLKYLRIMTLWDIKSHITWKHAVKIFAAFLLNTINSSARVLAPATLAKAVEMLVLEEQNAEIGMLTIGPRDLLFISMFLTAWSRVEIIFKKALVLDLEQLIIEKNSLDVIAMSHAVSLSTHALLRNDISKSLREIISLQSKLASEVTATLSQSALDIIIGTTIIWRYYGKVIGTEFLIYSLLDIFLLSRLIEYLTKQSLKLKQSNDKLQKYFNREYEIMFYEDTVRMFAHEELEIELSKKYLQKYLVAMKRHQFSEYIAAILKTIPSFMTYIIPISFVLKEDLNIADLDDFVFLLSYLTNIGNTIFSLNQTLKSCFNAIDSIDALKSLQAKSNIGMLTCTPLVVNPESNGLDPKMSPHIEFKDVSFTYPNRNQPTLQNLTFSIKSGIKLGIIGRSNAGKSTIVKLLLGIYPPTSGNIKINGKDISQFSQKDLCTIFCFVPQQVDLFRDRSLKYNVLYGSLNNSLLKAHLREIKKTKSESEKNKHKLYVSVVEQNEMNSDPVAIEGNNLFSEVMEKVELQSLDNSSANLKHSANALSGGQKQRVNIARGLAKNLGKFSGIFIFDEFTSSLDSFTEAEVMQNICKTTFGKTSIMITHRLSTIKDADEVIVLENGKIEEQGNPKLLLAQRQGLYYEYWQKQMGHS